MNASVSSCVEAWQNSERLANSCDYSDIQERRSQAMYKLQRDITSSVARGGGGAGGSIAPPPVGLPTKMQNKKNTTFLALLRLSFALDYTKK